MDGHVRDAPVGRRRVRAGDLLSVGVFPDDDADSGRTHVAYLGTFRVREAGMVDDAVVGIVEHHMHAASHPELLGEGPDRPFTIQGRDLMLDDGVTSRRVFMRVDATRASHPAASGTPARR